MYYKDFDLYVNYSQTHIPLRSAMEPAKLQKDLSLAYTCVDLFYYVPIKVYQKAPIRKHLRSYWAQKQKFAAADYLQKTANI